LQCGLFSKEKFKRGEAKISLFHLRTLSFIILKHLATPEEKKKTKHIRFYELAVMCEHVFIFSLWCPTFERLVLQRVSGTRTHWRFCADTETIPWYILVCLLHAKRIQWYHCFFYAYSRKNQAHILRLVSKTGKG